MKETEHVPVPALAKRNIRLGYTPDVLTDAGALTTSASKSHAAT